MIVITPQEVTIASGQEKHVFACHECRWWHGGLAEDFDLQRFPIGPVPAIVLECRKDILNSKKWALALDADAAEWCAKAMLRCHIVQQKPAYRRISRHVGWLIGPLLGLIGWLVSCFGWRWTVPQRAIQPLDIVWGLISWEFFGVIGFASLLVTWERFYVPRLSAPLIMLLAMFGGLIGYVTGRSGTIAHQILNMCIAWGLYALCMWWTLSSDRMNLERGKKSISSVTSRE